MDSAARSSPDLPGAPHGHDVHQYKTDFADIAYARGEARGEANALLAVLTARGIAVPADIRTRITSCTDTEQLADWLVKAATATTATEVFG